MSSKLNKLSPAFLKVIDEAARKVFGNLPIVNYRTGFKYLKRHPMGNYAVNHYIPDYTRGFRDVTEDFDTQLEENSRDRLARLKTRGKSPPKKGHGKRASKKKK